MAKADLTAAYENGAHISGAADFPDMWDDTSRNLREVELAVGRARVNLPYGDAPRQALDLFLPAGRAKGLLVFVHGGYWKAFDRKTWSFLSKGPTQTEWAVALPSYTLAPDARLASITAEIAQAITFAAGLVAGPIALAGHSAGGHLVARMNCKDVGLDQKIITRLRAIAAISPISDLRPLMQTDMNSILRIDAAEAQSESPVLAQDRHRVATHVWVGAQERPAFLEQARWLAESWPEAQAHIAPGRHHFDIIEPLCDPTSAMLSRLLTP